VPVTVDHPVNVDIVRALAAASFCMPNCPDTLYVCVLADELNMFTFELPLKPAVDAENEHTAAVSPAIEALMFT
jgi:hypothetical protein